MSDVEEDVVLTDKQALDAAVHAAWSSEGYVTASGEKDKAKLADALYAEVHDAVVKSRPERPAKAITRGTLVASVFPTLPGPDEWVNEPDPDLAEEVFKTISATVWDMLGTDRSKPVQRLIGERTSPRQLLCRYKLGSDRVDAVYVTRNKECIKEDLQGSYGAKLRRASAQMSAVTEMAIERVPEHGRAFARVFDEHSKGALEAGNSQLKLALLTTNGSNGEAVEEPYPADDDDAGE